MGTVGKEVLDLDIDLLIEKLNSALADEWLAYYQYWMGAKVVDTPAGLIVQELTEHATDELRHAGMLVDRILQLDGEPLLDPKLWFEKTNCGYLIPKNFKVGAILDQNIEGEQCAIKAYKEIMNMVRGKDDITYHMIFEIFKDEVEHEDDLEKLKESYK